MNQGWIGYIKLVRMNQGWVGYIKLSKDRSGLSRIYQVKVEEGWIRVGSDISN